MRRLPDQPPHARPRLYFYIEDWLRLLPMRPVVLIFISGNVYFPMVPRLVFIAWVWNEVATRNRLPPGNVLRRFCESFLGSQDFDHNFAE